MTTRLGAFVCGALLLAFAIVSYSSVLTKSPTFDEPVQSVAGWLKLRGDFRLNIEDPPLWEEWAALPNGPDTLKPDFAGQDWREISAVPARQWHFVTRCLWDTAGVDGGAFINRSRFMMLLVGLALGALIAFWSWRLAGPVAAVVSTGLFSFDPNFLGHAPLVKNDVAATLAILGVTCLVWRFGQRGSLAGLCGVAMACGLALNIKFSCLLVGPIVAALLGLRALLPTPWSTRQVELRTRAARITFVTVSLVVVALVSLLTIWGAYRFRFTPSPEPDIHIGTQWVLDHLERAQTRALETAVEPHVPSDAWSPDLATRVTLWALAHHVLPAAWLNGFLFTYATAVLRRGFLFDQISSTGFAYYFPAAIVMKTPLGTLAALVLSLVLGARFLWLRRAAFDAVWAAVCVVLPPTIYLLSSLRTHMNIGIRHILPVYAFGFVACGVVASAAVTQWKRPALAAIAALGIAIAGETLHARPDFIAFFNVAAGGSRNGLHLLGDSNLDWGQDLPLLAAWQAKHPTTMLYLSYFGMADPTYFGLRYRALPGNYTFGQPPDGRSLQVPAVVAISASHLQGLSIGPRVGDRYLPLRRMTPIEVLGGSIYLFDVPDAKAAEAYAAITAN